MNSHDLRTIRGYVSALPKGPGNDDDARVAVIAEDGTEYLVLHKGAGAGLEDNVNANVEVTGYVSCGGAEGTSGEANDAEQALVLTVKEFRLTDGFDDPWYDDDVE